MHPTSENEQDMRDRWERRAIEKGGSCSSVLFQGLAEPVNAHIHTQHCAVLETNFLNYMPRGALVLDLGCGYGRLAQQVRARRPDINLVGMDFSLNYCLLFRRVVNGQVICGDIHNLPFAPSIFDGVIAVTALMYAKPGHQQRVMNNVTNLLKQEGLAFVLDPGAEYSRLIACLHPASRQKTTGGESFSKDEYRNLAYNADVSIVKEGGFPLLSLSLPGLYFLGRGARYLRLVLNFLATVDSGLSTWSRYSCHRWMLLKRH
ncbi:MAG: class I SAM-dependent methyltransferase [Gammaproteobacteria bacterium]|nr:class I SAM-dependent methyltransferase [Gammaproteobacteria bacterium]